MGWRDWMDGSGLGKAKIHSVKECDCVINPCQGVMAGRVLGQVLSWVWKSGLYK
jgi:hypothetical protein